MGSIFVLIKLYCYVNINIINIYGKKLDTSSTGQLSKVFEAYHFSYWPKVDEYVSRFFFFFEAKLLASYLKENDEKNMF